MAAPASRARLGAVASAALALMLLVGGWGLAILLGPPLEAGGVSDVEEGAFVAQTTWGAKHLVRMDRAWLLERPLWEEKPTGRGVRVAVVDTGVDPTHPDLGDAIVAWRDFAGDASGFRHATPYDDHGHGTHVAAVVAGRGHFQPNPLHLYWLTGARGFAPDADLLVAKAMSSDGRGDDSTVAEAIRWAVDPNGDGDLSDGADVINLSVGIEKSASGARRLDFVGSETRRAVNLAILRGVVVVVSSGNDGGNDVAEPGDIERVITVGAVDRRGRPASFTNVGQGFDVLAPGVLISAYPRPLDEVDHARDGYAGLAGTSMAAPVVSGLVAVLLEADPTLRRKGTDRDYSESVARVEALVTDHAEPVPPDADGRSFGAGVVDARASLRAADAGSGNVSWSAVLTLAFLAVALGGAFAWLARRGRRSARDNKDGTRAEGATDSR